MRSVLPRGKERLSHIPKSCPKQITWDKKLQLKLKVKDPNLVHGLDVVLLHLLEGEPDRVLIVGGHHHSHPLKRNLINAGAKNWRGSNTKKEGKLQHFWCYLGSCHLKGLSLQFKTNCKAKLTFKNYLKVLITCWEYLFLHKWAISEMKYKCT